jgi:pimeloyl-ACP methyl ester carboxylesterase
MATLGTTSRVLSSDGTEIAYWSSGEGPPLVVVHGTTADHTRWAPLLPHLEAHLTVHAVDRRGRGASGDAAVYALEREFEDVAAVAEAASRSAGTPVALFGHSFGGLCALGAAAVSDDVRHLVLYEPAASPDANAFPPGVEDRVNGLLAAGDPDAALEAFFREVVLMPEDELTVFRRLPAWRARVAAAHTLPRELRAVIEGGLERARPGSVDIPTLMLLGGDSPVVVEEETATVADALADVRVTVLEGQQHIAIDLAPEVVAERVLAFLGVR